MLDTTPNMSGIGDLDHERSMHLVELALDFAQEIPGPGGDLMVKMFQGHHFRSYARN